MADEAFPHRLTPLLAPRSIAYVGATEREGAPGNNALKIVRQGGFEGAIYPINPRYESIDGLTCYPRLEALPETPNLAVLMVADQRLEATLTETIEAGVRAVTIFGGANLPEMRNPTLDQRLAEIAQAANLPICGGNCMGFYNLDHSLLTTFGRAPYATRPGNMTLINHSGSSWSSLSLNDGRLGFNLAISAGQELSVSIADYIDYALDQTSTRVIGLILETIRHAESFIAALEKATRLDIPVVALKVGRTETSVALALSHSGAIAGNEAAYEAVFDRYGVGRVTTLEALGASMSLLAHVRGGRIGPGGLVASFDSGYERELFVDLAADAGVGFPEMQPHTTQALEALLDPGLLPINPLDVWGTGHDFQRIFQETFAALMADPGAAIGAVAHSPRDNSRITQAWLDTLLEANRRTDKPMVMVTNFPWTHHQASVQTLLQAGIPTVEGMATGLHAIRQVFDHRDFHARPAIASPGPIDEPVRTAWSERLRGGDVFDEATALSLLAAYGIEVPPHRVVESVEQAIAAANGIGPDVVLKTAAPGIDHKSDVDGVRLGISGATSVANAYRDLSSRLGPRVLVAAMAAPGVEMSLGLVNDPQFGPLVLVGAGGVLIEIERDRRLALPNFDPAYARRLVEQLRAFPLLGAHRGRPACDVDAFCQMASRLSRIAHDLGGLIAEFDINPVIVGPHGAVAVDALLVPTAAS